VGEAAQHQEWEAESAAALEAVTVELAEARTEADRARTETEQVKGERGESRTAFETLLREAREEGERAKTERAEANMAMEQAQTNKEETRAAFEILLKEAREEGEVTNAQIADLVEENSSMTAEGVVTHARIEELLTVHHCCDINLASSSPLPSPSLPIPSSPIPYTIGEGFADGRGGYYACTHRRTRSGNTAGGTCVYVRVRSLRNILIQSQYMHKLKLVCTHLHTHTRIHRQPPEKKRKRPSKPCKCQQS
jgi:hypothetical protein